MIQKVLQAGGAVYVKIILLKQNMILLAVSIIHKGIKKALLRCKMYMDWLLLEFLICFKSNCQIESGHYWMTLQFRCIIKLRHLFQYNSLNCYY